jgi:hypothetical protein
MEVEKVVIHLPAKGQEGFKFNNYRPYVISINEFLPGAKELRENLINSLAREGILQQVVFEWFGKGPLQAIELKIGGKVPVTIAQAVLRACGSVAKIPVILTINQEDGYNQKGGPYGHSQRVYVGSLMKSGRPPATPEKLQSLLKPGLSQQEFIKKAME